MGRALLMIVACLASPALAQQWASPALAQERASESWSALETDDGNAIGWVRTRRSSSPEGTLVIETSQVRVREGDGPMQMLTDTTERRYHPDGRLLGILHTSVAGGRRIETRATFTASGVEIIRKTGREAHRRTLSYPPGWTGEDEAARLRRWSFARDGVLRFPAFSLAAQSFETVEIRPAPARPEAIQRLILDQGELRAVSILERDAQGGFASSTRPLFGTQIRVRRTTAKEAKRRGTPFSMDHAGLTKFPYRITEQAKRGHIRYTLAFRDGVSFPIPQTGEQRATMVQTEGQPRLVLDICPDCGPGLPDDAAALAAAREPTAWLQADAPLIRSLAKSGSDPAQPGAERMARLMATARRKLPRTDFAGHYSALEAVRRGAGDCTEDAVVLAALARAAGIPARVANGLVYTKDRHHGLSNVFMPHSWVIAHVDGRWQSFDISLGSFDATHIAFTVGDGDPRSVFAAGQLATLFDWVAMTEVRKRPPSANQPVGADLPKAAGSSS